VRNARSPYSAAGEIEIRTQPKFTFRVNVRDLGAVGDGIRDDSAALKSALSAVAARGGGTVWVPRGRYLVSERLVIPRHTTIEGEGKDLAAFMWSDFENPPEALLEGESDFAVMDLSLYASNHRHVVSGGFSPSSEPQGNVRIERVTIRASKFFGHLSVREVARRTEELMQTPSRGPDYSLRFHDALRLAGPNLTVKDSDIYGSGRSLYLLKAYRALISGNTFHNGRLGWYSLTGSEGVIFEGNKIFGADLGSTGGGINTLSTEISSSRNVGFFGNHFARFMGWDREAITSDGPGGFYFGQVALLSPGKLTLFDRHRTRSDTGSMQGAGVFVLGGKGEGQYARVRSVDKETVELDREWKVLPDGSSVVSIVPLQENYLIIDNDFEDAGVAVQFYGTSVNHVVASNRAARAGGYLASGRWYNHYQPSWYVQFLANSITEGNLYRGGPNGAIAAGDSVIGIYGYQKPPNTTPLLLGAVVRNNRLSNNALIEIKGGSDQRNPTVKNILVEGNLISRTNVGIATDRGVSGLLLRNNTFREVKTPRVQ
jgi:hypothetical protein